MRKTSVRLGCATVVSMLLWGSAGRAVTQEADAEAHRAWMNDAADRQEDLREALFQKAADKIAAAAEQIDELMAKTEEYWVAKKALDVVKLAQQSRAFSGEIANAARAGKLDQAAKAFDSLNATCNACHELHPEKR